MKSFSEMTPLEKILLGSLGVVLLAWFAWPTFDSWFLQPVARRRAEIASRSEAVDSKQRAKRQADFDERSLKLWTALSLPPDPLDAQRLYQSWLRQQAVAAGLRSPKVVPHKARVPHRGVYTTVGVDIDAEATFDQLVRFLYLVQRTSLMHRIAVVDAEATGRSPADPLTIRITAEGISLNDAKPRSRLLPMTTLAASVAPNADRITVSSTEGFPGKGGFEIRLGTEFLEVTDVSGSSWSVKRARHGSRAQSHQTATGVERIPVAAGWENRTLEDFRQLIANSPFAEPRVYEPRVPRVADQRLYLGDTMRVRVTGSGQDPSGGLPSYVLVEGAELGMQLDERGLLSWKPGADVELGSYPARVEVRFPRPETTREVAFRVELAKRNQAPSLAPIESITVAAEQTASFTATGSDEDGPAEALRYRLGRGAPTGATIDAETGEFRWTIGENVKGDTYRFEVVVTDGGQPAQSATASVAITVRASTARFTYLIGTLDRDGERMAWLYDRASNVKTELVEGEAVNASGLKGFVLAIGDEFVLVQVGDETHTLELGQPITEATVTATETEAP